MAIINNIVKNTARKGFPEGHISHRKDGDYIKKNGEWIPYKNSKNTTESKKNTVSFKKNLKKTSDISDYMFSKLKSMGYEVERKHSGISNSEYVIIKNAGDLFGKAKEDDVEIRISNHDLPASYDKQYAGDFDIRSEDINRNGTNGNANDYNTVLQKLYDKANDVNFNKRKENQKKEEEKDKAESEKKLSAQFEKEQIERENAFKNANNEEKQLLNKFYKYDEEAKKYFQNKDTPPLERLKIQDAVKQIINKYNK